MKRIVTSGAALTAALVAAVVALPGGTASARVPSHPGPHFSTTKTPYAPQERLGDYQSPPRDFAPVFAENVVRHGSRAMTDSDDGDAVLAVLRSAQAQDALTRLGTRLGPQVQTLLAGASSVGYGDLAGRGEQEQQGIALRMERRMPALFSAIVAEKAPIEVVTSGVDRAVASANAFTGGLTSGDPALAGLIQAPVTDKDLLYFHKQPQNADYQAYLDSDPDLAAVLAKIDDEPRTAKAARHVVSRLFGTGFAAAMSADDQIAFSRSLFELYSSAPDLSVEAPNVDLDAFLPAEDARWFAYLDDAEEFYQSGPAFSGRTITYGMAGVLLDDLFARVEARAGGTSATGAVLRFTHAEEIEPLAVLLGLPGSTRAAALNQPYSYQNNPWRGANVAPMAANVEWDLYAGTPRGGNGKPATARGTEYLVRMLYNEKETAFKSTCRPVAKGGYFYDLNELKRCFNRP
ncbi:histidine-type phosphatase [Actinoallomurus bryophytorum]|uniref:Multiple inositol polyphosphate phosphatase 1 n=1 Tax=Actinoallomurus bryophytorum TaxID=1490222 RepID=A0A543CHC2_9ACTN|nr:histidine-type phosphatase [Actinoallomurus bryophytorum]TQL96478.1 histidine phosphatase superfamily protein (branch 2) [Actinoallomurus bryophytorum]